MIVNKLPSALTEEELLEQLKNDTEIIQESTDPIITFLTFFNIEPGLYPVKANTLYSLYQKHKKESMNNRTFNLRVGKFLPSKQVYASIYFFINYNAIDIGAKTFALLEKSKHITKSPSYNKHFQNFIKANNIQDGDNWVLNTLLYKEYKEWCSKVRRKIPLSRSSFNKFLKLYFNKEKTIHNKRYTQVNINPNEKENKEEEFEK